MVQDTKKIGLPCTSNCQRDHEISTISGNRFTDVYSKNLGRDMYCLENDCSSSQKYVMALNSEVELTINSRIYSTLAN